MYISTRSGLDITLDYDDDRYRPFSCESTQFYFAQKYHVNVPNGKSNTKKIEKEREKKEEENEGYVNNNTTSFSISVGSYRPTDKSTTVTETENTHFHINAKNNFQ